MFDGKILLLSPHMDDEVLGCGGLIARTMEKDARRLHIHYLTNLHPLFDFELLKKENDNLIEKIGCTRSISKFSQETNKLEEIPIAEHISEIEQLINEHEPDTVLVTFPSYNQDHRRVFEAMITATRPHDRNYYVKYVLAYEQPETVQTNRLEPHFIPHVFLNIDIDKKCDLYGTYESQVRGHRSYEHLRSLAAMRGMQCNCAFAESYMVVRSTYR